MHGSVVPLSAAVCALLLVLATTSAAGAQAACEPRFAPTFSEGASEPGVVGVVERETLASNPLPWGASISAATRIWGGIRIDRWKLSDRRFVTCAYDPPDPVGWMEYDFRGSRVEWGDVLDYISMPGDLSPEDRLILDTRFGATESLPVTGVDRVMALVRVWGVELLVAVPLIAVAAAALVLRRRTKRHDRHLF